MRIHRDRPPPASASPGGRLRHPLSARVARAALFAALLVVCAAVAAPGAAAPA
ncbi:nodulation protein NfeD, partial [Burkholderia latens]